MSGRGCGWWALVGLVLSLPLGSGCEPALRTVSLDSASFDYGFVVRRRTSTDEVRPVPEVFGRTRAGALLGAPPSFSLEDDEELYVVALDRSAVEAWVPGYVADAEARLRLEFGTALVPPAAAQDEAVTELPPEARVHRVEADWSLGEPRLVSDLGAFAGLRLRSPRDPEYCRPAPLSDFVPFAAEALVRDDRGEPLAGLFRVVLVDDERALVATRDGRVLVVRRGGGLIGPVRTQPRSNAPPALESIAISPREDGSGRREVLIAGAREALMEGALMRGWLGPEGLSALEFVDEHEFYEGHDLRHVSFDRDGTAWIGGTDGLLLRRDGPEAQLVSDPGTLGRDRNISVVRETLDPDFPRVLLARGSLGTVDARSEGAGWSFSPIYGGLGDLPPDMNALDMDGSGPTLDLWAGGGRGILVQRTRAGLSMPRALEPWYPPRIKGCAFAEATGGRLHFTNHIRDLALTPDFAFLALLECSSLAAIRRSDLCVSLIEPEVEASNNHPAAVEYRDGELIVGWTDGRLMTLRRAPGSGR